MAKMAVGIVGINIKAKKDVDISTKILSRYNTVVVVRNKIQDVDTILKWTAFDAGMRDIAYTTWARANKSYEIYETGKHVEYILAWMLGAFAAKVNDDFCVEMSDYLDHIKKVDFLLIRNSAKSFIQVKFNNDKFFIVLPDVKLVKLGSPSTFEGDRFLDWEAGHEFFIKVLVESGLFEEEELFDVFEKHKDLYKKFNELWKILKY